MPGAPHLTGPLVQFQAIDIADRDGVFSLIRALAEQSSPLLRKVVYNDSSTPSGLSWRRKFPN